MLIASTEGGETPFVIGAAEKAAELSDESPWFLYCNPDEQLIGLTERTNRILKHSGVRRMNLSTGPMALSGSTRMQASTVLMYAAGLALLNVFEEVDIKKDVACLCSRLANTVPGFLPGFIEKEAGYYMQGDYLVYETHDDLGICVLTDTTERSPTFSLRIYENFRNSDPEPSLVYLCLPDTADAETAWKQLLGRDPRPLNWKEFPITTTGHLRGFDFSKELLHKRKKLIAGAGLHSFRIRREKGSLVFSLGGLEHQFEIRGWSLLHQHLVLKMILNTHSTLVMGKLGRYESNLMTYVRPSNNKLIDRSARYVMILLERSGIRLSYEEVIYRMFELLPEEGDPAQGSPDTEAIVLKTFNVLAGG
jgi:N-acetylmuramic acid 6-phosphate etherase